LRPRLSLSLATFLAIGCAHGRDPYAATDNTLGLDRVVLYRNGIGYFERSRRGRRRGADDQGPQGSDQRPAQEPDGGRPRNGQAVSVSMPLDPQMWANAALATLSPGQGSLPRCSTHCAAPTSSSGPRRASCAGASSCSSGSSTSPTRRRRAQRARGGAEGRVARLRRSRCSTARRCRSSGCRRSAAVTLRDGDLALQFHRSLDATAGEGMFQQVAVDIRLAGAKASMTSRSATWSRRRCGSRPTGWSCRRRRQGQRAAAGLGGGRQHERRGLGEGVDEPDLGRADRVPLRPAHAAADPPQRPDGQRGREARGGGDGRDELRAAGPTRTATGSAT
jgi:hypothetical protein